MRTLEFFKYPSRESDNKRLRLGCFVGNLTQEIGNTSELIAESTAGFYQNIEDTIYDNLKEATGNSELQTSADLKILASFIVSSWQGALVRLKVASDNRIFDEFIYMLETVLLA